MAPDNAPLIFGIHPVLEALRGLEEGTSGELFVQRGARSRAQRDAVQLARDAGLKVMERGARGLERLVGDDANHQGLVLRTTAFTYTELEVLLARCAEVDNPRLLVLDEIQDPHNLGALLRSAAAFDVQGVIIPERRAAPVNATAIKASAGTAFRVPVARVTNIARTLEALREARIWIYGAQRGDARDLTEIDWVRPVALVLGNEGKGLRRITAKHCDAFVAIDHGDRAESLNVSVAGGILMHHLRNALS